MDDKGEIAANQRIPFPDRYLAMPGSDLDQRAIDAVRWNFEKKAELSGLALLLCYFIEQLPASVDQTRASCLAGEILQQVRAEFEGEPRMPI